MGTELTYLQMGGVIALMLQVLAVGVTLYRSLRCFENYVNTGNFGDPRKSWFGVYSTSPLPSATVVP